MSCGLMFFSKSYNYMFNSIKLIERNQNLRIQETARPLCFLQKEMEF
jgi:hypothetical protein